jgi:hypothetical protein
MITQTKSGEKKNIYQNSAQCHLGRNFFTALTGQAEENIGPKGDTRQHDRSDLSNDEVHKVVCSS